MNRALFFLWAALLRRRSLRWCGNLRRPTALIGFLAVAALLAFLYYHRQHEIYAQLVRPASLVGAALAMLAGSIYTGFLQRGLVFEQPDIEFLFTGPFSRTQIVLYRLLPNYVYSVIQGVLFFVLFAPHLERPWVTTVCVTLFQIACFHVSAGAAIFGGGISSELHHRVRWMLLAVYAFIAALYLRAGWELSVVPSVVSSSVTNLFFYPAVTLSELKLDSTLIGQVAHWWSARSVSLRDYWKPSLYLVAFGTAAVASLWWALKLRSDLFEPSLATTTRAAERRARARQGHSLGRSGILHSRSIRLPRAPFFRGLGAIIWKNLVVATRSKRELALAGVFTLVFAGFLAALRGLYHGFMAQVGELPQRDLADFDRGLLLLMCVLGFFLQRSFPFDLRCDGNHLVMFRTLPVGPLGIALAEIAAPTLLGLLFQTGGLALVLLTGRCDWTSVGVALLVYAGVTMALNLVWNLHYLLAASKRVGGRAASASPVAMVMVVALSFLVFYPAVWTGLYVGRHMPNRSGEAAGFAAGLAVQYLVNFLMLVLMARLFQRFEVSRDS